MDENSILDTSITLEELEACLPLGGSPGVYVLRFRDSTGAKVHYKIRGGALPTMIKKLQLAYQKGCL